MPVTVSVPLPHPTGPAPSPLAACPASRCLAASMLALLWFALVPWAAGAEPRLVGSRPAEEATVVAVPAEGQRSRAERLDDGLVERPGVTGRDLAGGRDPTALELVEQLAEPIGQDRHLDLLQNDARDASAVAGLEEEGAIAGLADRARHESLGQVEHIETSGHASTLTRRPMARRFCPGAPGVRPEPHGSLTVSQRIAADGHLAGPRAATSLTGNQRTGPNGRDAQPRHLPAITPPGR